MQRAEVKDEGSPRAVAEQYAERLHGRNGNGRPHPGLIAALALAAVPCAAVIHFGGRLGWFAGIFGLILIGTAIANSFRGRFLLPKECAICDESEQTYRSQTELVEHLISAHPEAR